MTLSIPQHRDPVARAALIACALALCWFAVTSALPQASAQEQPRVIMVVATPTLPLPTEAPAAPVLSAPTAIPPTPAPTEAPPIVVAAPVQEEVPVVKERESDKAGPREHKAPPVVRH